MANRPEQGLRPLRLRPVAPPRFQQKAFTSTRIFGTRKETNTRTSLFRWFFWSGANVIAECTTATRAEQCNLPLDGACLLLLSAKQHLKRLAVRPWGRFLAAFSSVFAESAVNLLCRGRSGLLYDPFVGSGTTLVAAAKAGVKAVGNDLDPASAILSRARIASKYSARRVRELLKPGTRTVPANFAQETTDCFAREDLSYAASVFSRVQRELPRPNGSAFHGLLDDTSGLFDSEAIALAALLLAATSAAKVVRGSNPVWQRKAITGERIRTTPLPEGANARARLMMEDPDLAAVPGTRDVRVICEAAQDTSLDDGSVDFVLTSPPYLNRLDCVVNHLPELLLLTGFQNLDLERLRSSMIGTTKMVAKTDLDARVGPYCTKLLKRIAEHPGYGRAGGDAIPPIARS